jgi:diadenosine tetraphosphate (Ap4A) HIT family hydrolase
MADPNTPCIACRVASGEYAPAGGIAWRGGGFVLHAPFDPCPIPGWLVLTSERHARAAYDLADDEAGEMGRITARAMRAQRDALGAEHVYAFAIGDVLRHLHLHLVPRFADTPSRLRGRGCFDLCPGDALPSWRLIGAVESVRRALNA